MALVTGSARRIGAEILRTLHQAGFNVVIHCYHSIAEANALAEPLNNKRQNSALVKSYDLRLPDAGEILINAVLAWHGRLDLVINNASCFVHDDELEKKPCLQHELYALNVLAPWNISLKAAPLLAQHQGSIINITDIHADKPLKGYISYCQTKAALVTQTKGLARKLAPLIRVNAVAPGAIAWPEEGNTLSEDLKKEIINKTPLQCHGQPAYIAQAVMALVANPFITGQVITVDGGRSVV